MSIEMADQSDFDHLGLQEVANAVRESTADESGGSQKRKREESADGARRPSSKQRVSEDAGDSFMDEQQDSGVEALQDYSKLHGTGESSNGDEHANATSTAAAALGIFPTMTVPQPTDLSFQTSGDNNRDESFMDDGQVGNDSFGMDNSQQTPSGKGANKPAVGSDEWHKVRKDNHKEVERRRRETINEGINELAKIVPGCEKNKGSILQRAVSFITQLKENEAQNIEKWTLEKLLTEQAIAELSASNDKLKAECERAWREVETWKKTCQSAGLAPKKEDSASAAGDS